MSTTQPPPAPRRLLFRLLPGVVAAALVPFVALVAVAVSTVYDDTRHDIDSRLEQVLTQAARPLDAHLADALDRLSAATEPTPRRATQPRARHGSMPTPNCAACLTTS